MAVEIVFLIPVVFMFTLLVVAGGRYVSARGDMDAAARDAARAASFARTQGEAVAAIDSMLSQQLVHGRHCEPRRIDRDLDPAGGGMVTVRLHCRISYEDLGLLGLHGSLGIDSEGHAPIDTYMRAD